MIGIIKTNNGDVIVRDIRLYNELNIIKICFEQGSKVENVSISTYRAKQIGFMDIDKLGEIINNGQYFNR